MPVGLAMAISTHLKMKEDNNYSGRFWLILSYVAAGIQLIHMFFYFLLLL